MNSSLSKQIFALFVLIGFFDFIANKFYFYWTVWWFDVMMHFIGGLLACMLVVLFLNTYYKTKNLDKHKNKIIIILGVLIISVLWEIYELSIGSTSFADSDYMVDTISDFLMDFIGGFFGYLYSYKVLLKTNN